MAIKAIIETTEREVFICSQKNHGCGYIGERKDFLGTSEGPLCPACERAEGVFQVLPTPPTVEVLNGRDWQIVVNFLQSHA